MTEGIIATIMLFKKEGVLLNMKRRATVIKCIQLEIQMEHAHTTNDAFCLYANFDLRTEHESNHF